MNKSRKAVVSAMVALAGSIATLGATSSIAMADSNEFENLAAPTIANTVHQTFLLGQTESVGEASTLIYQPEASFIKVNFAHLTLPQGMAVEISSPDRSEVYQYGPGLNTAKTVDTAQGDNGIDRFSALSIQGDSVEIRLVGQAVDGDTSPIDVVIDHYQQGLPQNEIDYLMSLNPDGTESICGSDQKQAAVCFADQFPDEYAHSKPVARLLIGGRKLCTAWRVGPDNLMMTNNHCVSTSAEMATTEVWFNYQKASCGGSNATVTKVQANRLLETGYDLDFTLFDIHNANQVANFGYLGLDPRIPSLLETIYIPQHPGGRLKELGVVTDNAGTRCAVDRPVTNGRGANTDSGYLCDTEGGSSGSPVLSANSDNVIALHHLGGCYNKGAHISKIWPKIATHFPAGIPNSNVTGNGGGTTPVNQAPVADFSYNCDNLSCRFDAGTSYDSDGNIATYAWQFGDGVTSSSTISTHNYLSIGSYNVTLTVTDNGGKSDTLTQTVNVTNSSGGGTGGGATCTGITAWDASAIYLNGDNVSHNGIEYQAKWWTQGQNPEQFSSQWAVWKVIGACQ